LTVDGSDWSASGPSRFTTGERASGTCWIEGWVGLRDSLDAVAKRKSACPCQESNPGYVLA